MRAQYRLENHGTIWLVRPLTKRFAKWLRDTAPSDAQFFGAALAVEPRYLAGVIHAAEEGGF